MCKGLPSPLKTIIENKNSTVMTNGGIVSLFSIDLKDLIDINQCIDSIKVRTQIPVLRPISGIKWEPDVQLLL